MSTVTTVTAYIRGDSKVIDQPGFYARFRELLADFEVPDEAGNVIIAIQEEVDW